MCEGGVCVCMCVCWSIGRGGCVCVREGCVVHVCVLECREGRGGCVYVHPP